MKMMRFRMFLKWRDISFSRNQTEKHPQNPDTIFANSNSKTPSAKNMSKNFVDEQRKLGDIALPHTVARQIAEHPRVQSPPPPSRSPPRHSPA
jgi:hypothetical protein